MEPTPVPEPGRPERERACHPERARHPERVRPAVARGNRNLRALLVLVPLALFAQSCEDLPLAPNLSPSAQFIFNPVAPIYAGETTVTFNAVGSRDADGTIATYTWSWGDGTPEQSTTGTTITHVFVDHPGIRCVEAVYAVLLTVTDDKGQVGTASEPVTVVELPAPTSLACVGQ